MKPLIVAVLVAGLGPLAAQPALAQGHPVLVTPGVEQPHVNKRQARPAPVWRKGQAYRGRGQVVANYRHHRLKAPPRGHRWVQDGSVFLLVAVANGVIVEIVRNAVR